MSEQWRVIAGYPDYEVSDHGRVRRITSRTRAKAGTILKTPLRTGYPCVDLCRPGEGKKTHHVHRLVAAAFIGSCPPGHEVNHIDGTKTNSRAVNLEYVSSSENSFHAHRAGLQDCRGSRNGQAKLTEADVCAIRDLAAKPDRLSYRAIGEPFGVTETTVRAIVRGRTWQRQEAMAS